MKKEAFVRLNSWITPTQKKALESLSAKTGKSEAELVRDAIFKVYKVK